MIDTASLAEILTRQYHAGLAMLRDAIEQCPDDLWADDTPRNPFWRVAYHVLYFTHFYLQPEAAAFVPWDRHQTAIQYLDDDPPGPEFGNLGEHPHRPPQTGVPYTKAEVLEYWAQCDGEIDAGVARLDLASPQSGFFWYRVSKLEHQLINLRHLQHHGAQLVDRVRAATDTGVKWAGSRRGRS